MLSPIEKAGILVEALPYIKKFRGKTVVIKYGGHAMINPELQQKVMMDVLLMKYVGINPVVVHGGGPEITSMLKRVGKTSEFVNGLRITDYETMEIVEMVLVGKINKEIVAAINNYGGKAIGLSGKDGNLITANKKLAKVKNEAGEIIMQDIGFVGEIAQVNPEILKIVIDNGYIPVVAPVACGLQGESYNINADYVAGALAAALGAHKLILLTDVEGIYADYQDKSSLFSTLTVNESLELIERGVISGGMIPKVQCCIEALNQGVGQIHILDGRVPHAILLEVFTDQGVGTMVVKEKVGG